MIPWELFENSESIVMRMRHLNLNEHEQELFMKLLLDGAFNCTKEGLIEKTITYRALKNIPCESASKLILKARKLSKNMCGMSLEYIFEVIENAELFTLENAVNTDLEGLFYRNRFYPENIDLNDIFNLCEVIGTEGKSMDAVVKQICQHSRKFHGSTDEVLRNINADKDPETHQGLGFFKCKVSDNTRKCIREYLSEVNPNALPQIEDDRYVVDTVIEDLFMNYKISNGINIQLSDKGKAGLDWYMANK